MKAALVVAAFVCGALIALVGLIIGGAGHGWTGAMVSATALFTAPAGAVAWVTRRRVVAIAVIAVNLAADLALIALTFGAGLDDARSTWEHAAPLLIGWLGLWLGWQAVPLLVLRRAS